MASLFRGKLHVSTNVLDNPRTLVINVNGVKSTLVINAYVKKSIRLVHIFSFSSNTYMDSTTLFLTSAHVVQKCTLSTSTIFLFMLHAIIGPIS